MTRTPSLFNAAACLLLMLSAGTTVFAEAQPGGPMRPDRPGRIEPKIDPSRLARPAAASAPVTMIRLRVPSAAEREGVAKLKRLNADEFGRLVTRPGAKVVTEKSLKASAEASARSRAAVRAEFEKMAQKNPDLMESLKAERGGAGKATLSGKRTGEFRLRSADGQMRDLVVGAMRLRDAKIQADAYRRMHEAATAAAGGDAKAREALSKLPTPGQVASAGIERITKAIDDLARTWIDVFRPKPGAGKPANCAGEEGAGYGGDMTAYPGSGQDTGTPFSSQGLMAQVNFPLKPFLPCVRNQGNRGSCVSFCVTGAAEVLTAKQFNRFVNLSEQDLYKHMRLDWGPIPPNFQDDGYVSEIAILAQMVTGYRFPFERDWDYNPSPARSTNDAGNFVNSCNNYSGGPCSDTNHQAQHNCYSVETKVVTEKVTEVCEFIEGIPVVGDIFGAIGGEWVCETVKETIEKVELVEVCVYEANVGGTSGIRITGGLPVYNAVVGHDAGLAAAKFWLNSGFPLSVGIGTPGSFMNADSTGFVRVASGKEESDGGHCILAVGFVDNKDLPRGVSPGGGGGYLIIRNSWGSGWGDGGYAYLSYDWLKKWCRAMTVVTGVAQ